MPRVCSFLLCLLLLPLAASAQTVTISNEILLQDEVEYEVIGKFRNRVLLLEEGISDLAFRIFDENLYLQETVQLSLENKRSRVLRVIAEEDEIHVIYSTIDKDSLAIKDIRFDSGLNLIDTTLYWTVPKGQRIPAFKTDYSEDKSKVLLHSLESGSKVQFIAVDLRERKVLWEKKLEFEKADFTEVFRRMLISNEGRMFLILENDNSFSSRSQHGYEVVSIDARGEIENLKIPATSFLAGDTEFRLDNVNQQLMGFGLTFSNDQRESTGIFHLLVHFDLEGKYILTQIPFESDMMIDFYGKERSRVSYLDDVKIHSVLLRQDGGLVAFIEQQRELARQSYQVRRDFYNGSRFSVDYYYDNVVALGISPEGTGEFQKVLHKKQYSHDDDALYSSFFTMLTPKYVRILFNDDIRNESTVSEYLINGKGRMERKNVMSTEKQKLRLQIKNSTQLAYNEIVIPSTRNNRLKLVRVVY